MGLLNRIFAVLKNGLVFFLVIVLFPGIPPKSQFPFEGYSVESPLDLVGPLALNNYLDKGERLLEGRLSGPEHLIIVGKDIFTGLNNGEVVRINGEGIIHVAKFGQACAGYHEERQCGRPLGMAYDANRNHLIVADAYYGIWEIDLKDGHKKLLISPDTTIEGETPRKPAIFNSVALHSSGDIYFTDSSSEFCLEDALFGLMANPSGRLIHWDRKKNVSTALIDELHFANGVLLSPDEDFIVMSELVRARVLKYYLKGTRKGTWEVFATGLPGHPDNITPSRDGFWVALVVSRDAENPSMMASRMPVPLIRKFFLRIFYLVEFPFQVIKDVYPNEFVQKFLHKWGHLTLFSIAFPPRTTLIKMNWKGEIVGALHGFDQSVHTISHVAEDGDYLYLGGPFIDYIGRVKLSGAATELIQSTNDVPPVKEREQTAISEKDTPRAPSDKFRSHDGEL